MNKKTKIPCVTVAGNDGDHKCRFTWNDDMSFEILLRLSGKSLTRFKLTCKHGLSLISSDEFCRLHTLRHPKPPPSLLLQTWNSDFFYLNPIINGENLMIPYHFSIPNPEILSSCNGLMLLQSDHESQTDYYVYNPTTKKSRKLSLTQNDKYKHVVRLDLAFDPSKSPHYKIVCVRTKNSYLTQSCQIEVYNSESHTWKVCLEPATMNSSFGVHCNNKMYWPTYRSIFYFDMDNNVTGQLHFPKIPWPQNGADKICNSLLQETNGHLHLVLIVLEHRGESVWLWELGEDDHSQWFLKYHYSISLPPHTFRRWIISTPLRLIRGSDGGQIRSLLTYDGCSEINIHSFLDKSYEKLVDLRSLPSYYQRNDEKLCASDIHQFGESLALV